MNPLNTSIKISDYVTSGTPRVNKTDTRLDLPRKEHQGSNNRSDTEPYTNAENRKKPAEEDKENKIDIYA